MTPPAAARADFAGAHDAGSAPIDPRSVREAARWLMRAHAGEMSDSDVQARDAWRARSTDNERAWRRAELIGRRLERVPADIGLPTLRRAGAANRRAALKTLTALITVGPAAWLACRAAPWQAWAATERTATGERRTVVLPDGGTVMLNTASAIDIVFDDAERRILLHAGEILVQTAADDRAPARPFIVDSAQGRMQALGTRFIVTLESTRSRVGVTDGAVKIAPAARADASVVVAAGQQVAFDAIEVGPLQPLGADADAWAAGVLHADGMRLDDFLAQVARYRPGILRCDPAVAHLKISGVLHLDNTDAILAALGDVLPVRIVTRSRYWITVVPV